jgi:hypothetical protein
MVTRKELEEITPESVLSEFHLAMLSPNAVKVYVAVWKFMSERNQTAVRVSDDAVSLKARVQVIFIPDAQRELAMAGLLELLPGDYETQYGYVEQDDPTDDVTAGR